MKQVTFISAMAAMIIPDDVNMIAFVSAGEEITYAVNHTRYLRVNCADINSHLEGYMLFNASHAIGILDFIESCGDEDIVVHCQAGVSRSAALASFMCDYMGYTLKQGGFCSGNTSQANPHIYGMLSRAYVDRRLMKAKDSMCISTTRR